jgi:hypothetical protein
MAGEPVAFGHAGTTTRRDLRCPRSATRTGVGVLLPGQLTPELGREVSAAGLPDRALLVGVGLSSTPRAPADSRPSRGNARSRRRRSSPRARPAGSSATGPWSEGPGWWTGVRLQKGRRHPAPVQVAAEPRGVLAESQAEMPVGLEHLKPVGADLGVAELPPPAAEPDGALTAVAHESHVATGVWCTGSSSYGLSGMSR